HSRAAHQDKIALSSPHGETIPAVSTLESRNNRISCLLVTAPAGPPLAAANYGDRLGSTACRSAENTRSRASGKLLSTSSVFTPAPLKADPTLGQSCSKRCCSGSRIRPSPIRNGRTQFEAQVIPEFLGHGQLPLFSDSSCRQIFDC